MRRINHINQETGKMPILNIPEKKKNDLSIREVVSGFGRAAIISGLFGIGLGSCGLVTEDLISEGTVIESESKQAETNAKVNFLLGGICLTAIGVSLDAIANSKK